MIVVTVAEVHVLLGRNVYAYTCPFCVWTGNKALPHLFGQHGVPITEASRAINAARNEWQREHGWTTLSGYRGWSR